MSPVEKTAAARLKGRAAGHPILTSLRQAAAKAQGALRRCPALLSRQPLHDEKNYVKLSKRLRKGTVK